MVSAAHPPARHRARVIYRGQDLSTLPVPPEPHPEMTAETRQRHLWLVESAVATLGTDADAISAAVVLPAWNVRRALHDLGLAGPAAPNPRFVRAAGGRPSRLAEKVGAWLAARNKPATAADIADGCGLTCVETVNALLNRYPDRFRRRGAVRVGRGKSILWTTAKKPDARGARP